MLQLNIRDGHYGIIEGLDPQFSWSDTQMTKGGHLEFSYGIESKVRPTFQVLRLPRRLWCQVRANTYRDWKVTARVDWDAQHWETTDLRFHVDNHPLDLRLSATAWSNGKYEWKHLEMTKGYDTDDGARWTVTPRYDFDTREVNTTLTYAKDRIRATVLATDTRQAFTLSRQINDKNRIAPTLTNFRKVSFEWERELTDTSSFTTFFQPNEKLIFEHREDSGWTISAECQLLDSEITGTTVRLRREVNF